MAEKKYHYLMAFNGKLKPSMIKKYEACMRAAKNKKKSRSLSSKFDVEMKHIFDKGKNSYYLVVAKGVLPMPTPMPEPLPIFRPVYDVSFDKILSSYEDLERNRWKEG